MRHTTRPCRWSLLLVVLFVFALLTRADAFYDESAEDNEVDEWSAFAEAQHSAAARQLQSYMEEYRMALTSTGGLTDGTTAPATTAAVLSSSSTTVQPTDAATTAAATTITPTDASSTTVSATPSTSPTMYEIPTTSASTTDASPASSPPGTTAAATTTSAAGTTQPASSGSSTTSAATSSSNTTGTIAPTTVTPTYPDSTTSPPSTGTATVNLKLNVTCDTFTADYQQQLLDTMASELGVDVSQLSITDVSCATGTSHYKYRTQSRQHLMDASPEVTFSVVITPSADKSAATPAAVASQLQSDAANPQSSLRQDPRFSSIQVLSTSTQPPQTTAPPATTAGTTNAGSTALGTTSAGATSAPATTSCGAGLTACGASCYDATANDYHCCNNQLTQGPASDGCPTTPPTTTVAPTGTSTLSSGSGSDSTTVPASNAATTSASTTNPPQTPAVTQAPPPTTAAGDAIASCGYTKSGEQMQPCGSTCYVPSVAYCYKGVAYYNQNGTAAPSTEAPTTQYTSMPTTQAGQTYAPLTSPAATSAPQSIPPSTPPPPTTKPAQQLAACGYSVTGEQMQPCGSVCYLPSTDTECVNGRIYYLSD